MVNLVMCLALGGLVTVPPSLIARGADGELFFRSLVQYLAVSLSVKASFVAEFNAERTKVLTLAVWVGDRHVPDFEFDRLC
jgi:hypothetical protein